MMVLQAGFHDGRLFLWGETASPAPAAAAPRRGRKPPAGPPRSPYDAGHEHLSGALADALPGLLSDAAAGQTLVAWLPSADGKPVASTPIVAEPPEPATQTALAPWTVSVLPLPAGQAVELLCACVDKETLAPGLVIGKTLACWAAALRFAGSLVARQQFLPAVETTGRAAHARWEPVIAGGDAQRLAAVAKALSPACRALTSDGDAPPGMPVGSVLSQFLRQMVDHLVRSSEQPAAALALSSRRASSKVPAFDSVHDLWLHALRSPDGAMPGDADELVQLATQVREWRRPIDVSATAPFRLCFRLEEPEGNGEDDGQRTRQGPWHVRYLLQAVEDPSLLLPAEDAWAARGRRAAVLRRGAFKPQEYLLSSLGHASALCPRIEDSLKAPAPAGYELDVTAAHEFLTEKAWLLEQSGFGILLPAWWTRKGTKVRLAVRANVKTPGMQGGGGLSLDQIIHFNWEVALGDQTLSLTELETLARLKAPLVKVRGQWVQ
ncbi:MAG TPA: SNF2 helicase-associated domain-containing protein, partial [Gemmataceae bacterium]|nr:SNF2 helicase-associated domain-containing protein [Gemmataceae bacterium]